jgi:hypothetical protein
MIDVSTPLIRLKGMMTLVSSPLMASAGIPHNGRNMNLLLMVMNIVIHNVPTNSEIKAPFLLFMYL